MFKIQRNLHFNVEYHFIVRMSSRDTVYHGTHFIFLLHFLIIQTEMKIQLSNFFKIQTETTYLVANNLIARVSLIFLLHRTNSCLMGLGGLAASRDLKKNYTK